MEELCLQRQEERWKMSALRNVESLDITDESLSEYLRSAYADRSFDDFSRLLHELVVELRNSKDFRTVGDLHNALERTKKTAELLEAENPPSQLVGSRYSAIGMVRISVALLLGSDFFATIRLSEKLRESINAYLAANPKDRSPQNKQ
jgi:hypothetical protein